MSEKQVGTNLFDNKNRTDQSLPRYQEPRYYYLNNSARVEAKRIRLLLDEWFSRYPSTDRDDLRSRFRSRNDNRNLSGFFELYLYELLLRLKCSIKVHPTLSHTSKKPDFLVTTENKGQFFLEAVVITGETNAEAAQRAQIHQIYDVINNRIKSKEYFIGLDVEKCGEKTPKAKELASFIDKQLSEVSFEDVETTKNVGLSHKWRWQKSGWEIEFFPIPKLRAFHDEDTDHIIGMTSEGVKISQARHLIRKTIKKKQESMENCHFLISLQLTFLMNSLMRKRF